MTESRPAAAIAGCASVASRSEQARDTNIYFPRAPHTLAIARILRALSRIRAELVGEFSLAIRRGSIYGSIKQRSNWRGRQEH